MTPELTLDETMQLKNIQQEYANVKPFNYTGYDATLEYYLATTDAFNKIYKDLMESELSYYANNQAIIFEDTTAVDGNDKAKTQDNVIKKLFTNLLNWISKVKDAINAAFQAVNNKIIELDASNKSFLKKIETEIPIVEDSTIEMEGHNFINLEKMSPKPYTMDIKDILAGNKETDQDSMKDLKLTILNAIVFGIASPDRVNINATYNNANSAMKNKFKDGEDSLTVSGIKDILNLLYYGDIDKDMWKQKYPVKNQIEIIEKTASDRIATNRVYFKTNNELKKVEADLKASSKTADSSNMKNLKAALDIVKFNIDSLSITFNAYSQALIDRNKQARAVCIKAISQHKEEMKKDVKKESATYRGSSIESLYNGMII